MNVSPQKDATTSIPLPGAGDFAAPMEGNRNASATRTDRKKRTSRMEMSLQDRSGHVEIGHTGAHRKIQLHRPG